MNILKLSEINKKFGSLSNSVPFRSREKEVVYVYDDDLPREDNSDWNNSIQETGPDYTFLSFFDGINKIWHLFKVRAVYRNRIKTSSGIVDLKKNLSNLIEIQFNSSFNERQAFEFKMEIEDAKILVKMIQSAIKNAKENK